MNDTQAAANDFEVIREWVEYLLDDSGVAVGCGCERCSEGHAALAALEARVEASDKDRHEARHMVRSERDRAVAAEARVVAAQEERDALRAKADGWVQHDTEAYAAQSMRALKRAEAAEAGLQAATAQRDDLVLLVRVGFLVTVNGDRATAETIADKRLRELLLSILQAKDVAAARAVLVGGTEDEK